MGIIAACGGLFAVGLAAIVAWGGLRLPRAAPVYHTDERAAPSEIRFLWWMTAASIAGATSGVLIAGAGGRLVMRLIAHQAPEARGRTTEAQATIGEISMDGTIALFLFGGLPAGVVAAVGYVAVRRWMPRGRLGGLAYGFLLLLVLAPRIEPLRANNIDFDLVGPGWLSMTVLSALVVLEGMFVAAVVAKVAQKLPLPESQKSWPYLVSLPALVLAVLILPVAVIVAPLDGAVALAVVLAMPAAHYAYRKIRGSRSAHVGSGRDEVIYGLVVIGLILAASLPRFVSTFLRIVG